MTTTNNTYNPEVMWNNIQLAMRAVTTVLTIKRREWLNSDDEDVMRACNAYRAQRGWISDQMNRFTLHPVIKAAIDVCRPNDWHQLFLEWPHMSENDRARIAYTQNEAKGLKNIQTVTSVGKYLTRHFDMPDHIIRDLVARYGTASKFQFVHTTAEMIYHLERGPRSCMVWDSSRGVRCSDGVTRHPYEAYNPKYGWHMAVRIDNGETVGRALCLTSPIDGVKYYVRSYARPASQGGYSETDNAMENWLREQGYAKEHYWRDGEKLAYHESYDHFLAPYLDGGEKRVTLDVGNGCVVVDSDGEYICDQTGGIPTDDSGDYFECEDCGDRTEDGDGYWVGYNEDTHVCESCYENDYVNGYGRNGREYSFPSNVAVYVQSRGEHYHEDYLGANDIVELENGEYEELENAIEVNGDWYHIDDERLCRTEDTDEYLLCDDGCWQCTESGMWYTDGIDFVEVNGDKYHPNYAPEQDEDTTSDTTPDATLLTMSMLDQIALFEDYGIERNLVRFSMTILHDGTKLYAHRDLTTHSIALHGLDNTRISMRRILSTELMHMASINANVKLESTDTI